MADFEELRRRVNELDVLVARAGTHLQEVRTLNRGRENEAMRNYSDFVNKRFHARRELEAVTDVPS